MGWRGCATPTPTRCSPSGRADEAREWFARAAEADEDAETDAAERLLELDGVVIDDLDDEDDEDIDEDDEADDED